MIKISKTGLFCLIYFVGGMHVLGQRKADDTLMVNLLRSAKGIAHSVVQNPDAYRLQIIYTQIDRSKKGEPQFKNYYYHVDPNAYFNPASMVKMPLAFLSLEKLNEINRPSIDKYTWMKFDSSYPRQVAMLRDTTARDGKPTIAHFIKRALLISENDPYNRMYQFVGQGESNQRLLKKGYASTRITRQFMGFTEEQNRRTNGIQFFDAAGNIVYSQSPAFNTDSFRFPSPILIGDAHIDRNENKVNGPFDFTRHNSISLEDMQQMLQAVIFPQHTPTERRFNIKEEDRLFLLQYLSQYPSETDDPKYDEQVFYDSYVKFFFQDSTHQMPPYLRVFNKVGWAYGFMTDVSYVVDTRNHIDYFLSATIYVNSDGVVNDSKYDEETVGFPFFKEVGRIFYEYELKRKRTTQPPLNTFGIQYGKRDPKDTRKPIQVVDN